MSDRGKLAQAHDQLAKLFVELSSLQVASVEQDQPARTVDRLIEQKLAVQDKIGKQLERIAQLKR